MSDIREILGIQGQKQPTGPVVPGTKATRVAAPSMEPKQKKPRLSREVMSLKENLRTTMPTLVPSILSEVAEENSKKFKAKVVLGTKKPSKWIKRPFKNPGRTDGVQFSHWARAKRLEEEYRFAKLNRKLNIPKYTDEEYEAHFTSSTWTRKETDYLFEMLNNFDLRFVIVADRWNPPQEDNSLPKSQTNSQTNSLTNSSNQQNDNHNESPNTTRTVEELKDRYYSIQRKLLELRKAPEDDISQNPLLLHPYDPIQDSERKRQQDQFSQRSVKDLEFENEMNAEWARIDSTFRKHSEEALKVLRLIKKQQKYYANLKVERQAYQATKELDEKARNKQKRDPSTNMDEDMPIKVTRRHPAAYSRTHSKAYTATLLPILNQQKYAPFFTKALAELQIEAAPRHSFIMASAMNELRCDLILFRDLQKLYAEKQYEIEVLKRLQQSLLDRRDKALAEEASTNKATIKSEPESNANTTSINSMEVSDIEPSSEQPSSATTTSTTAPIQKAGVDQDSMQID